MVRKTQQEGAARPNACVADIDVARRAALDPPYLPAFEMKTGRATDLNEPMDEETKSTAGNFFLTGFSS